MPSHNIKLEKYRAVSSDTEAVNTNSIEQSMPPRQRRRARLKTRVMPPILPIRTRRSQRRRGVLSNFPGGKISREDCLRSLNEKLTQDPQLPSPKNKKIFIGGCAKTEQNEGTQEKPNFERNGAGSEKPTTLTNNFGRSEIWWFTESDEKKSFERIWLFAAWRQNGIWRGVKWKSNFEAKAAKWSKMQSTFTLRQF